MSILERYIKKAFDGLIEKLNNEKNGLLEIVTHAMYQGGVEKLFQTILSNELNNMEDINSYMEVNNRADISVYCGASTDTPNFIIELGFNYISQKSYFSRKPLEDIKKRLGSDKLGDSKVFSLMLIAFKKDNKRLSCPSVFKGTSKGYIFNAGKVELSELIGLWEDKAEGMNVFNGEKPSISELPVIELGDFLLHTHLVHFSQQPELT